MRALVDSEDGQHRGRGGEEHLQPLVSDQATLGEVQLSQGGETSSLRQHLHYY